MKKNLAPRGAARSKLALRRETIRWLVNGHLELAVGGAVPGTGREPAFLSRVKLDCTPSNETELCPTKDAGCLTTPCPTTLC